MTIQALQKELEQVTGKPHIFKFNENRSTMLSVRWEPNCTKVSIHRFFLEAPVEVVEDLGAYISQTKRKVSPKLRAFIEMRSQGLDYSHLVCHTLLITQGKYFDLKPLLEEINREYFDSSLSVAITWYGGHNTKSRSSVIFGQYDSPRKLVKIHRRLDGRYVPEYVLRFVIYHEMLHAIYPPKFEGKERCMVHHPEFRRKEREFCDFKQATAWIERHKQRFFK